jgi:hypothetical protein
MTNPNLNKNNGNKPSMALTTVDEFADRLERAARQLFGNVPLTERLSKMGRQLQGECRQLAERAESSTPTLVILGKVGEGKSWLARCFLTSDADNHAIREQIETGQPTERLLWFGPEKPLVLGDGEQYRVVDVQNMLDLGHPYVVGDAPGFSQQAA